MSFSRPLYRAEALRRIEAAASREPLMLRAGQAAAEQALVIANGRGDILLLAGPGNNGGDAFETARRLNEAFCETCVVFPGAPGRLPPDAREAFRRFRDAGGRLVEAIPERGRWSLIVDGLFGIGLTREIAAPYAGFVEQANALARRKACPLLALDCPSGLDADTGVARGATIRASHTLSFIAAKPGLYTADGPDHCGEIAVAPLGLDEACLDEAHGRLVAPDLFAAFLVPRRRNSHKGSYGSAGVLGGDQGLAGAALLAARAALRLGSGRVYAGLLDRRAPGIDPAQLELMLRPPEKLQACGLTALACGPGLGDSHEAAVRLEEACALEIPLVFDADALNLLAARDELRVALAARDPEKTPLLLTPHPAEAARLLECRVADVQTDRIAAARKLAWEFNAFVALKGVGTVVAMPDGAWFINATGHPGLATAGSGDVLTGFVTALLAQGWPPAEALLAAVHLHGAAADRLAAEGVGPIGLTAGELIDGTRRVFNDWIGRR